jgi:hypothetical protein
VGTDSRETSQEPELDWDRYKSPEINVGSASTTMPTNSAIDASRIPDSWDDYSLAGDLSDCEFSGEPEFESPEKYLQSRGVDVNSKQPDADVSIDITYNGASKEDLAFLNAAS